MDDGSRCLLDVINDPNLFESFLENGAPEDTNSGVTPKAVKAAAPKKAPVRKQTSKKGGQNTTVTSSTSDAKQVDLVTSSGCVNSPPMMSGDGTFNKGNIVLPSPMSIQGTTTIQGQQLIRSINPNMSWRGPHQFIQGGLPQVIQTIGGQMVLTRPSLPTNMNGQPTQQPQPGQLVQIVQTPTGPAAQLIPVPHQSPVIQPVLAAPSKGTKGGNKQILPKPSSGASPGPSGRQSVGPPTSNQSPIVQTSPQTISLSQPGNPPQFIFGGSQGAPSIISGPNGTILLNSGYQNYGQNFVLQGNNLVGNVGPVQLTLRAPTPQIVNVSNSNSSTIDPNIMNAINTSVSNPMIRGAQPSFVMNNQGPTFAPRGQNIVFNRPSFMTGPPPGTQLIQIQTPNGPMMIALQTNPQVFSSAPGTITMQSAPQFVQSGSQTTLFDPRTQLMPTNSGPMIITQNVQQPPPPPPPAKTSKRGGGNKSKGVNLADLLKETGILPDSSPPSSPNLKNTECDQNQQNLNPPPTTIIQPSQQPMFMMPPAPNQPNIVLGPNQAPQLRLALTPDGNVVLQQSLPDPVSVQPQFVSSDPAPTTSKLLDNIKDTCGPGSSQPSPDSTTPTLDSSLAYAGTPQSSKFDDGCKRTDKRDGKDSDSLIPVTVENLNGGIVNEPSDGRSVTVMAQKSNLDQPVVSGTPVIDSTGAVQISLNNHEFLERLDSQIKELNNSPSLTPQQKQLLHEFTKLQNTISEAKKQSSFHQQQLQQQSQCPIVSTQVSNTQIAPPSPIQTQSGVQLVNLLKPSTPTQQIRLISSPTVTSQPGSTYQLGNQLITFSTPSNNSIPTMTAAIGPPLSSTQPPVQSPQTLQMIRVQTPKSPSKTSKPSDSQVDREKLRLRINKLFNQQLTADQNAASRPDTKTPFRSRDDACKRLLRYHVFAKPTISPDTLAKVDEQFESVSRDLLIQKELLFDRFRKAVLKRSMGVEKSEMILVDRLFVEDETTVLKFDKEVVAQGRTLDLPSPPESWKKLINESIDAEEEREERKRKLPFLDEDLSEHLEVPSEAKRIDNDSDDTEDDDDDSDEDDDDNQADDIAKYLGPGETESAGNLSDLNSLYGEIGYDQTSNDLADFESEDRAASSELLFDGLASTSQDSWGRGSSYNDRTNVWSTRFAETEAAAAVDSILTSDDEDDQSESKLVKMNCLEDDDDDEEDEDDDDADEVDDEAIVDEMIAEEEESSQTFLSETGSDISSQPLQDPIAPCDVQMQSAIDSILQSSSSNSYYDSTGYGGRAYEQNNPLGNHRSSTNISSFGSLPSGQISDPVLDEAVKSILS